VTTDLLVENVHFRMDKTLPRLLGRKAMTVNLSDVAAMGGTPLFALLGLAAPADFPVPVLMEVLDGFIARAREDGVALIGGDVVRGDRLTLAVTLIGESGRPGPVYRRGAAPGDLVFVSGTMGDSALGLTRLLEISIPITEDIIAADPLHKAILCHLDPPARLGLGRRLAGTATAMMDLSDGLLSDLPRLLLESGDLGAIIEVTRLPLSPEFRTRFSPTAVLDEAALGLALGGGEDYELLFTAQAEDEARVVSLGEAEGIAVTRIGKVIREPGLKLQDERGVVPLPRPWFEHFQAGPEGGKP
jgi:thiamine-monophosphate kinase